MDEREMMRRWVETWKQAGPELEAIRREEIRNLDPVQVLPLLEDVFNQALQLPPRPSSGMVEMQAWFARLRHRHSGCGDSYLRQQKGLDWRYIEEQLTPLAELKEDPGILRALRNLKTL